MLSAKSLSAQNADLIDVTFKPRLPTDEPLVIQCQPTAIVKSDSGFRHLPDCKEYRIRMFYLQQHPGAFRRYLTGNQPPESFFTPIQTHVIDTTQLSSPAVRPKQYFIFTGINNKGEKIVIIDTNQDRDFGNDEVLVFDTACFDKPRDQQPALPAVTLNTGKGRQTIKIDPYNSYFTPASYASKSDQLLELSLVNDMYWIGALEADGQVETVYLWDGSSNLPSDPGSQKLSLRLANDGNRIYKYARQENIKAGNNYYSWERAMGPDDLAPVIRFKKVSSAGAIN